MSELKQLRIDFLDDDKLGVQLEGALDLPTVMQALCTVCRSMMDQTTQALIANPPDPALTPETIKGDIYDMANVMFSNTLVAYAPEIEMRPDLTCEAILKAENEILDALPDNDNNVTAFPAQPDASNNS